MKKLILTVACAAFAMVASAQQMEWGVKAGLNLATVTNIDDAKMKPSKYLGAFVEFRINDYLGIQPEAVYSRQGWFEKEDGDKAWMRLNYLNIPILAKVYVLDQLSLDLGPQFGILLNAKARFKTNEGSGTVDIDNYKNFDVSFPIGLTYRINNFDITGRYVLGLTEIVDTNGDKPKNSVIQLGVGYRF